MNEQTSPAVYGLFFDDTDQTWILGLYFTEGEANGARLQYIEEQVVDFFAEKQAWAREEYVRDTFVKRLALGQVPSHRFTCSN